MTIDQILIFQNLYTKAIGVLIALLFNVRVWSICMYGSLYTPHSLRIAIGVRTSL